MIKAVIFDIDGTLSPMNAWDHLTVRVGGSLDEDRAAFADWGAGRIPEPAARQRMIANWSHPASPAKATFQRILEEVALRDDAPETVVHLGSKGYLLGIITGSFDLYAEIVGKKLDIADTYALTTLHWDALDRLRDIKTYHDGREPKYKRLMAFCEKHNLAPEECVAVGDGSNDMELFRATKRGIAVKTEFEAKELEAIAWKKIRRLNELRDIL